MTWSPYGEAQRYKVTLKKASGVTATTVVTYSTSWTPTGTSALVPEDGPFHWTVQAVDRDNRTTLAPLFGFDRTFSLSGTPADTAAAPLTPLAPSASGAHEKFPTLKWEPWNEGDPARYYKVFVGAASGSAVFEIADNFPYPRLPMRPASSWFRALTAGSFAPTQRTAHSLAPALSPSSRSGTLTRRPDNGSR